jgi:outer membrane protein OmpA-like peptidoglycan-associated protein
MGLIGKQVQGKGLSALTDLIMGQKSAVSAALPAGLGSLMGFADFGGNIPQVNTNINTSTAMGGGNNWLKWLLPILLGAAVLYWLSTKGCGKKVEDAATTAIEAVDSTAIKAAEAASAVTDSLDAAMDKLFSYKLSSGFELVGAAKDGIESQLVGFIEDGSKVVDKTTWFNFDRLLFDTGKATLQAGSKEQLVNIAEILKAFPKVKLNIGGYTDNTGDPKANQKLSTDRAFNVMNELIVLGIDKTRLKAEGYGDKFPVADNATEEGRQQNRRIAVRVTEK